MYLQLLSALQLYLWSTFPTQFKVLYRTERKSNQRFQTKYRGEAEMERWFWLAPCLKIISERKGHRILNKYERQWESLKLFQESIDLVPFFKTLTEGKLVLLTLKLQSHAQKKKGLRFCPSHFWKTTCNKAGISFRFTGCTTFNHPNFLISRNLWETGIHFHSRYHPSKKNTCRYFNEVSFGM